MMENRKFTSTEGHILFNVTAALSAGDKDFENANILSQFNCKHVYGLINMSTCMNFSSATRTVSSVRSIHLGLCLLSHPLLIHSFDMGVVKFDLQRQETNKICFQSLLTFLIQPVREKRFGI